MVQINNVNTQKFSLNGVEYFKNFTPIVVGNRITIVNTYDSRIVIVPLTEFQDFEVDAVTYASVILLQTALLPVIFTRDSLGITGDFLSNDETTYTPATLPLTGTEVAVLNDGTNWVKITWNNIKAQLKTYFDAVYQAILVSGTNIKTINGTSILGSGDLVVSGGGGSDYLLYKRKWRNIRLNSINTWRAPAPTYDDFDNNVFSSLGTGTTPNSTFFLTTATDFIPTGYLVDSIELELSFNDGIKPSALQVYIARSEVNSESIGNGVSNTVDLVNQTISVGSGSIALKFMKSLTVASHSAPTLAKSFLQIAVRETLSTDIYNSLCFNIIYKKI